jgi:hypothetical protein
MKDDEGKIGNMKVNGYVRNKKICVNYIVNIKGWGDFKIYNINQ